jgi:branched-chain amino acid transport system substrate-binding protein
MSDPRKFGQFKGRIPKAIWHFVNRNLLAQVLSAMLSLIVVARITNWWTGPQFYRVYVVGSFNPSEEITKEVWQGFTAKGDLKATIDDVSVVTDWVNDAGDPSEAANVARALAGRSDTLMVVGHLLSTQSQVALNSYLVRQPIPVILATETNPKVLPPHAPDESPYPVFRLSPTDDEQARIAADFAVEEMKADRFWIVKDTRNQTYSTYLAAEFQNRVVSKGKHVVMTTTTDAHPDENELKKGSIDCVFFAGDESHAIILIDQIISTRWGKKPRVMLSDWSVGPNLILRRGQAAEGIFLTHPLAADVYNKDAYVWYGKQAREIVEHLIRDANLRFSQALRDKEPVSFFFKRVLSIHRVGDARTAVGTIMNERHTFQTPDITYKFDHEGKSATSEFHIWQIQNGKFVECEQEDGNCK